MTKINNFADMKNVITFLFLFSLIFFACETEFEVNANWKEVTIVYGLLDQSQEQQYIKINKAYLGEGNALEMASIADSTNYNPEDLEVKIFKVNYDEFSGSVDTLGFVILSDTILEKDPGLFATNENIIYTTSSSFFPANKPHEKEYILSILNKKTSKEVWAQSNLIKELEITTPCSQEVGFYGNFISQPVIFPIDKSLSSVKWNHSTNGEIYKIIARIYYTDFFLDGSAAVNYIDWPQSQIEQDGSTDMRYSFDGKAFVNTLADKITKDTTIHERRLHSFVVYFTVGSEDLETYMDVNRPFEGIVQERPVFTNINNGIGLFACRYNATDSMFFNEVTREGVSIDLGGEVGSPFPDLKFVFP